MSESSSVMAGRRRKRKSSKQEAIIGLAMIAVAFAMAAPPWLLVSAGATVTLVLFALIAHFLTKKRSEQPRSYSISARDGWPREIADPPVRRYAEHQQSVREASVPDRWSRGLLNDLDWRVFEQLVADYFRVKGWSATVTSDGADGGVDVRIATQSNPEALFGVVQCKAWNRKRIGVSQIRELFGVMGHVNAKLGIFVSIAGYTDDAWAFAKNKHIKLLDADDLLKLILSLSQPEQAELLGRATSGDYRTPSCPSCGVKFVKRMVKRGRRKGQLFWGCRNFPGCRNTMQIRSDEQISVIRA